MRLTVNLDGDSDETLERLAQAQGMSKSQIVRDAIDYYRIICQEWQHVDKEAFEWYARLLGSGEHRIFDVDHVDALLSAIGTPSEGLLSEWERIGHKHGVEWQAQFDDLETKLRVLEYCNWYTITKVSDDQYTLTTQSRREAALVCSFLEGECDELGLDTEFRQVDQKILVTDRSD
jgi:predicted transcriptional regulator